MKTKKLKMKWNRILDSMKFRIRKPRAIKGEGLPASPVLKKIEESVKQLSEIL